MKPGKKDIAVQCLISGMELEELQKHSYMMCEAFGLDSRIDRYKGKRPISFHQWDLECLDAVLDYVLNDAKAYPNRQSDEYVALNALNVRLKQLYKDTYEKKRRFKVMRTSP